MQDWMHWALGLGIEPNDMTLRQMSLRAVLIFFAALVLIRIADKRFMANKTGFDLLLVFILGSTLSRSINGPSPLFKTIAIGFIVVILHRILAMIACRSTSVCKLLKGSSDVLIQNGRINEAALTRHNLTEADILEDMRLKTTIDDIRKVREARIERNGEISVIPMQQS
jgi:uncharacterized membrane protein YcaP (DUF421 family)